jgi:hypothetical protein
MGSSFIPFFLIPILVYTYFWINPLLLSAFLEGMYQYLVEIYLGYKEWKIEREAKKAFSQYQKRSKKLAKENGFPTHVVSLYFEDYGEVDFEFIKNSYRSDYEKKHKDFEDDMRDMLAF